YVSALYAMIYSYSLSLVAALADEVLYALVHGPPRRGYQARHGGHDAVVARGYHVGTRSQDGNQLEHVIVVGVKYRSARELLGDLAAGLGVEPLHGHEDRKYPVPLQESLCRFAEAVDVLPVFPLHLRSGLEKVDGAILTILEGAGRPACKVFSDRSFHRPNIGVDRT